ncbi:TRAP transporter small permease [Variovorax sp. PCZ-1]|uniref:TRAP transporter small permease n=1 Tax=Variovorax sp. PCZ-1 TaxID=2835533 RepID=UPI001BCCE0C0|nr:TRAP transporter small permease [Variovorax sp. PCZ-1]MBS7808065.1 TRAP transporter small permease [Variovorax sp. PCZ-1]
MKLLGQLAKFCAIVAGLLMVFITLMTVTSVIGRDTIGKAITGDFELSGAACGAAVGLFMPWCQYKRGNIIVDFFTAKAGEATVGFLDRAGALILGIVMAVLAWRTTLGGISAFNSNSGTMMLGFPEWIVYSAIVPGLALTAVIAFTQAVQGFAKEEAESNPELAV